MKGKIIEASADIEAFYADSLKSIARLAKGKYKNSPKVIHMIACLGKAQGMLIAACEPGERRQGRETAIKNMDLALGTYALTSQKSPMS